MRSKSVESSEYIGALCGQLAGMADQPEQATLCCLLRMAELEAKNLTETISGQALSTRQIERAVFAN
jgi:hypothetical protein